MKRITLAGLIYLQRFASFQRKDRERVVYIAGDQVKYQLHTGHDGQHWQSRLPGTVTLLLQSGTSMQQTILTGETYGFHLLYEVQEVRKV